MRRAKADLMKSAINSYLKRRRYSELAQNFKPEPTHPVNNSHQMAIMSVVEKELSRSNSITYSNIANDTGQVEHQFTRLKSWIADMKTDSYRFELASFLCPLFCHLYLEMLCGSHRQSATKFFKRHHLQLEKIFLYASRENSRELLEELACVSSSQDIEVNPYVKSFRSAKYHLKLSTEAVLALQKYLTDHGHVLILQTMQKWFDVEIMNSIKSDLEDDDLGHNKRGICKNEDCNLPNCEGEADLDTVKNIIREVRQKPAPVNPLLLYRLSNARHNVRVSKCKVNNTVSMLAVGVDSTIRIWGLAHPLKTPTPPQQEKDSGFSLGAAKHDVTMYGHSGPVQDVSFVEVAASPRVLLSVSQDATMRSWALDSYQCVAAYRGHNHEIWSVDVCSLGLFAVTGSRDRTARLWSLERNFPIRTCAGHQLDVECTKFHPNNMYFATGSADKTVRMWSVSDARLVRLFPGHRGAIQSLAFSPDGKYLASGAEDRRIKIWDLGAGKILKEFKGHTNSVISLCWDKTSEYISSCSIDGTVRQWSLHDIKGDSSENPSTNLLRTYTFGSGLLSVQHSKFNTLVCVAAS